VDNGDEPLEVVGDTNNQFNASGEDATATDDVIEADVELTLSRAVELLRRADKSEDGVVDLDADDDDVTLTLLGIEVDPSIVAIVAGRGGTVTLSTQDLKGFIAELDKKAPAPQQLLPNNGAGTLIGNFVYNTVTSLYVGEKLMIEMPTWFFPAGAGPFSESGGFTTHGEPSPVATFRFAEPIFIDKQQNFRVEIEAPDSQTLKELQKIYGPFFVWVVLDGYMTRDVQ
jgi:hypothetical protein